MLTITNGKNTFEVTHGAYGEIFKDQGYTIMDEVEIPAEDITEVQEEPEEVNEFADLELKPISEWSKEELREYAEANGIDLGGVSSSKEAKSIIKKFIDNK